MLKTPTYGFKFMNRGRVLGSKQSSQLAIALCLSVFCMVIFLSGCASSSPTNTSADTSTPVADTQPTPAASEPSSEVEQRIAGEKNTCERECRYDDGGPGCQAVCDCLSEKLKAEVTPEILAEFKQSLQGETMVNPRYMMILSKSKAACEPLRYAHQ